MLLWGMLLWEYAPPGGMLLWEYAYPGVASLGVCSSGSMLIQG